MKHFELLQRYVANLAVWNVKLHNLHWNVEGLYFLSIHDFTEEIYDRVGEKFDEVAELLKVKDQTPLSTIAEYLEAATLKEVPTKAFTETEALETLKADLELMKGLASEIRNTADEEDDFEVVAIFDEYVMEYSKNLWFVDAMLK